MAEVTAELDPLAFCLPAHACRFAELKFLGFIPIGAALALPASGSASEHFFGNLWWELSLRNEEVTLYSLIVLFVILNFDYSVII